MITSNISDFSSMSTVKAKVDIYNGDTLVKTCTCSDFLQDFKITREGDLGKFFGFGVCHKLSINFIDLDRELNVAIGNHIIVNLGDGEVFDTPYPIFYVEEVDRDEKSNTITATAYDKLYSFSNHQLAELALPTEYTPYELAIACANKLGILEVRYILTHHTTFGTILHNKMSGNFDGNEDLRSVLTAISEISFSIYYIDNQERLIFKVLDRENDPVFTITKDDYYELTTKTVKTITGVGSATELGDNIDASKEEGVKQFIRNNPLLDLLSYRSLAVSSIADNIDNLSITQFDCDWGGDYRLEIGDKLGLVTENNEVAISFLLSDITTYSGTLSQETYWHYEDNESETLSNPVNIGDKINQTFARVDKVNKEIELLITDVTETSSKLTQIQLDLDNIDITLEQHSEQIEGLGGVDFTEINEKISQIELDIDNIELSVQETSEQADSAYNFASDAHGRLDKLYGEDLPGQIQGAITESKEYTKSEINIAKESIELDVSKTYETKTNVNALDAKLSTVDEKVGKIDLELDNIELSITESNEQTLKDAKEYADGKDADTLTSSKEYANSQITLAKNEINLGISQSYETKGDAAAKLAEAKEFSTNADAGVITEANQYTDSQITIAKNAINLEVSETYETKAEVTKQITDSETETKEYVDEQVANVVTTTNQKVASLQVATDGINASVSSLQSTITSNKESAEAEIDRLVKEVNLKMDEDDVTILVTSKIESGIDKVTTASKKYTFDDDGLNVSSSGNNLSTFITEDGMQIYRAGQEVLTANNEGVKAEDLHATTYLIIGNNSRLEDRENRTACYWIGE